jgi:hypothetical protein
MQVDEDGIRPQVWPNVGRCFLMAVMLNMHIELYGESQAYMGDMVSVHYHARVSLWVPAVVSHSRVWLRCLRDAGPGDRMATDHEPVSSTSRNLVSR